MTATPLSDRIARFVGVEPDEVPRVSLLFGAAFLLISLMTTIKVVRDATFLSHFGILQLSYLMLGMAVLTGIALALFNRATLGRPRHRVIWALNGTVAITLVLLSFALRFGGRHIPVVLYAWAGISGLAVLSEFWLLANDLFHARQAKRLFATIAAGGVLGGIFGGTTCRILAKHVPVADLLLLAAGELLVVAILCDLAWRGQSDARLAEPAVTPKASELVKIFRESAYVRGIAAVTVCMTVATTLADWQFKAYAKLHFASHETEMARFFSVIAIALGVLSLLLQMIGTNRLLRFVGANGCMRALPVSCGIGAALLLATLGVPLPTLVAAAIGSMLVDGVKFSVDRSATELLFTPLPDEARAAVKRFVDTALDRFAGALAALIWLALVWFVHVDRPGRLIYVSVATLVVVAAWLVAVARLHGGYVDAYRAFIGAPTADAPVRLMSERGRQRATRLLAHLDRDAPLRHRALRALTRLQTTSPMLGLDPALVAPHIERELDGLELLERVDRAVPTWGAPPLRMLHGMVKERIARGCERIIRLLAMLYPPGDVTALHRALRRRSERQRAGALAFLDALVDLPSKQRILAVLEASALTGVSSEPMAREEGLRALFAINDSVLRACAVWSAVSCSVLLDEVRTLHASDPSRTVRAAARISLATKRARIRPARRDFVPPTSRDQHAP